MRKLFFAMAIFAVGFNLISCADDLEAQEITETKTRISDDIKLSELQQKSLNWLYFNCAQKYAKEISAVGLVFENPTNEQKLQVIRFCDYFCDYTGKYVCEFPEYDDVREILWPNGFGDFDGFPEFRLNESDFQ